MCGRRWGSIVPAMTETTTAPGPMGPSSSARPLFRDPSGGKLAGVCAGMGRYTDTDPVIWRIVVVVLAVFGGTGVILYLLGWLLIPKVGADGSLAGSWLSRRGHSLTPKAAIILGLIALVALGGFDDGRGVGAIVVLAVVGYLVYRDRQGLPVAPSYTAVAPVGPDAPDPLTWAPGTPMIRVPRERSRLGLITISLAALVTGALVWAELAGADGFTAARTTAVALIVIGGGLVVGTWYGRARWLVAVGLLLCLGLGTAVAFDATGGTLRGGIGQRTWVVNEGRSSQSFTLGAGEATLDLTDLPSTGGHVVVHSRVSLGHLVILVPGDVAVRVHSHVKIGDISEFGKSIANGNRSFDRTRSYGPVDDPRVEVEATVGTGQIEVRHG